MSVKYLQMSVKYLQMSVRHLQMSVRHLQMSVRHLQNVSRWQWRCLAGANRGQFSLKKLDTGCAPADDLDQNVDRNSEINRYNFAISIL